MMMNIKQLKKALTEANVDFPAKAKKAELEALLAAAQQPADEKKPRAKRASTKDMLRELFPNVGDALPVQDVVDHILAQHKIQPATIQTMIGDLRNPKYAAGPMIDIRKQGDDYVRVDDPS